MFSDPLHLYLLFFLLILPGIPSADDAYTSIDFILVNCGAKGYATDLSNRIWQSDEPYAVRNSASTSPASTPNRMDQSLPDRVPYQWARIFHSQFNYSFPVSTPGHKFLRLYFYPETYDGFDAAKSFFSLTANNFTLFSNFSASLNVPPVPSAPVVTKEFIINVLDGNQGIKLTFSPNPDSFAFVNGIEIVSLPEQPYFWNTNIQLVPDLAYFIANDTTFETLYRLNVGGADVQILEDSGVHGMFRYWSQDDDYVLSDFGFSPHDEDHIINYTDKTPPYTAPKIVYRTSRVLSNTSKSLEWAFPVDSGFNYLLRLHFCETQLEVTERNQRVFTIKIDNQTAVIDADIILWAGGTGIPVFKDYMTWVPNDGHHEKRDLQLSLLPTYIGLPLYSSVLLNGLEIFKLNDSNQSLAAANPDQQPTDSPRQPTAPSSSTIYAIIGSVIGVLAVVAAGGFQIIRRRKPKVKDTLPTTLIPKTRNSRSHVLLLSNLCRHFSLDEIKMTTANFDEKLVIGRGGFGNVYKGFINDGATTVAVKRLHSSSNQGALEFMTEIQLLTKLRHLHLVSLIGYCDEKGEMILVYDYMPHGTLRDHLYNSNNPPLMWKHRLQICLGAAKGLDYLHTSTKHAVIHRDVKSTNILLDEKWVAKVSDFGLSKIGPSDAANTHITTAVKGSFGYLDPEYYKRHQLTDKSDVYSFGVVLFEVLCGRAAILPCSQSQESDEQVNLAEWANFCYEKGTIDQIVDLNLDKNQIAPECLNKFVETAITCLRGRRIERPAMSDVVRNLEHAMQLQEAAEGGSNLRSATSAFELGGEAYASQDSGVHYVEPFSELVNPAGR